MPLNHTIRLINNTPLGGLEELLEADIKADLAIIVPEMVHYKDEIMTPQDVLELGKAVGLALNNHSHVYFRVTLDTMTAVITGLKLACYTVCNLLTIPLEYEITEDSKCSCFNNTFKNETVEYFIYATLGKGDGLRHTNLVDKKNYSSVYPANWSSWFKGDRIQMYRTMIQLSSNHTDTVLDPFMSTGDIGVSAIDQDRHYIGIEFNRTKFDFAKTRLDCNGE